MLQIISGKFFAEAPVNTQECDAILYSNYSWVAPIKLKVAELRPVDTHQSRTASYVLRYTNRYQPGSPRDPLVLAHGDEAVEQFRLLASFCLRSYFHVDQSYVEHITRDRATNSRDTTRHNVFVPHFFDVSRDGKYEEQATFIAFVDKVLAMSRVDYRLFMSCVAGFFQSLETVGDNFDLAYSMMVYMLEALSKSQEQPLMTWGDYEEGMRSRLDKALASVPSAIAEGVRNTLLKNPHLKLKKRFINFIASHVSDNYFTGEAEGLGFALAKSELERAAANLYDLRSGYVHELKQVPKQLRLHWYATENDVFHWENEPHLTFAGLARLAWHVLKSFAERRPQVVREDVNWRSELPGRINLPLSPEYWIWESERFTSNQGGRRYSGLLELLMMHISKPQISLPDLRPLLSKIEVLTPISGSAERIPMLAIYWLFNVVVAESDRRPNWANFLEKHRPDIDHCSVEWIAILVYLNRPMEWASQPCVEAFETYLKNRHRELATRLPKMLEIAVMAAIGNRFRDEGDEATFGEWVNRAIHDAAGRKTVQDYLRSCLTMHHRIETDLLLGRSSSNAPAAVSDDRRQEAELEDQIRRDAYFRWQSAGSPNGDGAMFWLEAEREQRGFANRAEI